MSSDEIKALRAALGLTLARLAERCGVTLRTVQYWEAGERKPSGAALLLLEMMAAEDRKKKRKKPKEGT